MALVTVQRSPSPSTENDLDTLSSEDTVDGKSHLKKRLKTSKDKLRKVLSSVRFLSKLRPRLSESYFAFKGAALILPHTDFTRKSSKKSHGGEIHGHLQAMLHLLRPEDQIRIAVRLEEVPNSVYKRYICVVGTRGRQDTEEAVILGMDCGNGEAAIGLVLPVWLGLKIQLEGDGSFRLCTDEQAYLFNPVSVQAMWSAIQSLVKVLSMAEEMKYIHDGLTHTWVEYYRSKIDHHHIARGHHWNIEGVDVFAPSILVEDESVKISISKALKEVMLIADLEEVTCRALRLDAEEKLGFSIQKHKTFFDEEMMRIFGQMDAPSKILDFIYLGSEWNASNLDELKELGVGYVLNVTKEIDNFFAGTFHYYTVRVKDVEEADLLKHWDKTFKFIAKAKSQGSKVLVHCKRGISRSASTVMAYLMKENRWSVDEAFEFVHERRNVANPNSGFMEQLRMYEGILSASNKRDYFRTKSADSHTSQLDDKMDQEQGCVLGDSMMNVMSSDWMALMANLPEGTTQSSSLEDDLEQLHDGSRLFPMGPDMEGAESRSGDSLEESLPDFPSPTDSRADKMQCTEPNNMEFDSLTNPSISSGPFKIKPDSFWIRQESQDDDTEENASDTQTASCSGAAAVATMTDCQNTSTDQCQVPQEASNNLKSTACCCSQQDENNRINPSSLSECNSTSMSIKDQSLFENCLTSTSSSHCDISSLSISGATSSFIPISPITTATSTSPQDVGRDSHISPLTSVDQNVKISSSLPNMRLKCNSATTATTTTPPECRSQPGADKIDVEITQGESNKISSLHISEEKQSLIHQSHNINTASSSTTQLSMQSKDSELSSSTSCPTPRTKLEVGVREYFFREKIPWSPGKVQKIRDGIDREGFIRGDLSEEREGVETVASPNDIVGNEEKFKMDIDRENIVLDECMEVVSSEGEKKEMAEEIKCEDMLDVDNGALSLYEKEEIPLEPGTVLRTRMEIEERQKVSRSSIGEGDLQYSPTAAMTMASKPISRTSSLKMAKECHSSSSADDLPRRVSCGPVMEPMLDDSDYLMEEGDVDDVKQMRDRDSIETRLKESEMEESSCTSQETSQAESRTADVTVLTVESSDTVTEQDQENSGIVKSFVRKIEKLPDDNKRKSENEIDEASTEGPGKQLIFLPLSSSLPPNSNDAKIDIGFISGESTTDSEPSVRSEQKSQQESEDMKEPCVRHLVDQFETISPECNQIIANQDVKLKDVSGDTEDVKSDGLVVSNLENVSDTIDSQSLFKLMSKDPVSSTPLMVGDASCPDTSQLPGNACMQSNREKEVWNPYHQQLSPPSASEDIQSLRKRFECNVSQAEGASKLSMQRFQNVTGTRKQSRPKSMDRMYDICPSKSRSDDQLMVGGRKEELDASLRQVSEEGRKVRRLHGKSHPLTKLSQPRGDVFHSSM